MLNLFKGTDLLETNIKDILKNALSLYSPYEKLDFIWKTIPIFKGKEVISDDFDWAYRHNKIKHLMLEDLSNGFYDDYYDPYYQYMESYQELAANNELAEIKAPELIKSIKQIKNNKITEEVLHRIISILAEINKNKGNKLKA